MAPGAARNALDCALWDMEARQRGLRLWQLAGCDGAPTARVTAYTLSLGTPGAMAEQEATAAADGNRLLKIKLTGEDDRLRFAGVRRGAPAARLVGDAIARWGGGAIFREAEGLTDL